MNCQEEVLVGGGSDEVCRGQESPVKDRGVAKEVCTGDLSGNDAENNIFGERFRTTKLSDLNMAGSNQG